MNVKVLCLIVYILLSPYGAMALADSQMLEEVRFAAVSADEEQVIFKLNGPHIPKAFAIKDEKPRVVFDFAGVRSKARANVIEAGGHFIKTVRIGMHETPSAKTRVVLDLQPGKEVAFDQHFDQGSNQLTITVHDAKGKPAPDKKDEKVTATASPQPAKDNGRTSEPSAGSPATAIAPDTANEEVLSAAEKTPAETKPDHQNSFANQQEKSKPEPVLSADTNRSDDQNQPKEVAGEEKIIKTEAIETKPEETEKLPAEEKAAGQEAATSPADQTAKPPAMESTTRQTIPEEVLEPAGVAANGQTVSRIQSIQFDKNSNRGEMVLFRLNQFHPPVVFGLEEQQPRVVCDFTNALLDAQVKEQIEANGRYVKAIRVGRHSNPDKVRVVLDLAPNNSYDLQQVFFKEENLFVLIINTLVNGPVPENKDAIGPEGAHGKAGNS